MSDSPAHPRRSRRRAVGSAGLGGGAARRPEHLTGLADVSAAAALLLAAIDRMTEEVAEKERLLNLKSVLAEEVQHRVRNNLQLIYGMLIERLNDAGEDDGKRGLLAIARRVSSLAQVYDDLLGDETTRTTDFGGYVRSVCANLAEIQAIPTGGVTLTCENETLPLELDTVTALGLVVTELVANGYDHAFPEGTGTIAVSVRRVVGRPDVAEMIVADTGFGFPMATEGKRHGLAMVRRLVEQARGTAERVFDNGTVWTIRFPVLPTVAPIVVPIKVPIRVPDAVATVVPIVD